MEEENLLKINFEREIPLEKFKEFIKEKNLRLSGNTLYEFKGRWKECGKGTYCSICEKFNCYCGNIFENKELLEVKK